MTTHRILLIAGLAALLAAPVLWWFERPAEPGLTIEPETWTADPPLTAGSKTVARFTATNRSGRPICVLSYSTC